MESTTHDQSLSSDILMEILTRSSLETIACCRVLSKDCNSLTYEATFKNLLGQRTNITSGFFLQSLYHNKYSSMPFILNKDQQAFPPADISLDFLPSDVKMESSTRQGIMLFRGYEDRIPQFYVCKPTTRQGQRIPNPKTRYQTAATGMIVVRTKPLHYKIVRLSEPKHCSNLERQPRLHSSFRCELFDSQTFKWKQLPQVDLQIDSFFNPFDGSVLASGTLHWLTYQNNIVAFQADNESWTSFSVPPHLKKPGYEDFKLVEYGGKLGFVCMGVGGSFMEVWVMEGYEQRTWKKNHSFDLEFFTRDYPYSSLVGYYPPGIVVMKSYNRLFWIDPKAARYGMVELNHSFNFEGAFQFESDFEIEDFPSCDDDQSKWRLSGRKTKDHQKKKCTDISGRRGSILNKIVVAAIFVLPLMYKLMRK